MVWHWVSLDHVPQHSGQWGCIVLRVLLASLSFPLGLCSVTSLSSLGILFAPLEAMEAIPHADLLSLDFGCLIGACVGSVLVSRGTVVRGGITSQR